MKKERLIYGFAGSLAAALVADYSAPAFAQEQGLDQLVVTARRREETLEATPIVDLPLATVLRVLSLETNRNIVTTPAVRAEREAPPSTLQVRAGARRRHHRRRRIATLPRAVAVASASRRSPEQAGCSRSRSASASDDAAARGGESLDRSGSTAIGDADDRSSRGDCRRHRPAWGRETTGDADSGEAPGGAPVGALRRYGPGVLAAP